MAVLLSGIAQIDAALALRLFAWQRYAEISADRAGLVTAGGLDPAARALFNFAGGVAVVAASGTVTEKSLKALEQLL